MLAHSSVQATIPATDLQRARRFYAEKLGLTPQNETPDGTTYECGDGTRFFLFPSSGTASGQHTQMGWTVDDIESEVARLKARGVVFEEYDAPGLKTVNGIATTGPAKAAWFRDSEGNLLGLIQNA